MSVSGKRGVGIPIILLHDAEGGIITVEMKNGIIIRGILDDAQDNMNCTLKVINFVMQIHVLRLLELLTHCSVGRYEDWHRRNSISN